MSGWCGHIKAANIANTDEKLFHIFKKYLPDIGVHPRVIPATKVTKIANWDWDSLKLRPLAKS